MRIITGKYKGRKLHTIPGNRTRPTTDFMKEAMFSVIENCDDNLVLDLYAGTGSLGLEALSRGAAFVDFIEMSSNAMKTLFRNIDMLDVRSICRVNKRKVSAYLKVTEKKYDLILMDPPYDKGLIKKTIDLVQEMDVLKEDGLLVIEHSSYEPVASEKYRVLFDNKYGNQSLTVLINDNSRENVSENI